MKKIYIAPPQPPTAQITASAGNVRVTFPELPTIQITAGAGKSLDAGPSSSGMTLSRLIRVSRARPSSPDGTLEA